MKLERNTKIMFLVNEMAKSDNRLDRLRLALRIFDLMKDEETENYLRNYYLGL